MDQTNPAEHAATRPWALPAVLAIVLALMVGWRLLPAGPTPTQTPEANLPGEVLVEIRIEGQEPLRQAVPPTGGSALAVLRAAGDASPAFSPDVQGEGSSAFVRSIGGIPNEGSGGRNWTYSVNDHPGDHSAAIAPVKHGDRVLWKFALPE